MPRYNVQANIDNDTLIQNGDGIISVNPDSTQLNNKQDKIDPLLTDTSKNVVTAINNNAAGIVINANNIATNSSAIGAIETQVGNIQGQVVLNPPTNQTVLKNISINTSTNMDGRLRSEQIGATIDPNAFPMQSEVNASLATKDITFDVATQNLKKGTSTILNFDNGYFQGLSDMPDTLVLKTALSNGVIATHLVKNNDYTELTTTSKKIIGAINELKTVNDTQNTDIASKDVTFIGTFLRQGVNNILFFNTNYFNVPSNQINLNTSPTSTTSQELLVTNIYIPLITTNKTIIGAINECNDEIMQGFPFRHSNVNSAVLVLGSASSVPKISGMFKKRLVGGLIKTYYIGNDLDGTVAGNRINEATATCAGFGTLFRYSTQGDVGTTTGTTISGVWTNGTKLTASVDYWYANVTGNTLTIIGQDGSATSPVCTIDISSLT